jgi:hypothetical protein
MRHRARSIHRESQRVCFGHVQRDAAATRQRACRYSRRSRWSRSRSPAANTEPDAGYPHVPEALVSARDQEDECDPGARRRVVWGAVGEQTLLERDGHYAVHSLPFERLNAHASIALVGLTPGRGQAAIAFGAARSALLAGATPRELLERVHRQASFGGRMRTVLVRRLDGIGLPRALGIQSATQLFAEADSLVHTTSALRYMTLRDGKDYGADPTSLVA